MSKINLNILFGALISASLFCSTAVMANTNTVVKSVSSAADFVNSGIILTPDDSLTLTASGTWNGCNDPAQLCVTNADGNGVYNADFLLPSAPEHSLIGSLNGGTSWFSIGVNQTQITGNGSLILAANRDKNCGIGCRNRIKSGAVDVTMSVSRAMQFSSSTNYIRTWNYKVLDRGCSSRPAVDPSDDWSRSSFVRPRVTIFPLDQNPWLSQAGFTAAWFNGWSSTSSKPVGSGKGTWTRYATEVEGNGVFNLRFLADFCAWVYLDGNYVGMETTARSTTVFPLTLSGKHTVEFIIHDIGGDAGGMFLMNTLADRLFTDYDDDGVFDSEEDRLGTNKRVSDTDGDGFSDGEEVDAGSDPLDINSVPYQIGQCIAVKNYARLDDRAQFVGDKLHAGIQVMLRANAKVQGDVVAGNKVVMRDRSKVTGDVTINGGISLINGATIDGVLQQYVATDDIVSNDKTQLPSTGANVYVGHGKVKVLAPGQYKNIVVNDRGTLKLSAGVYVFDNLTLSNDAKLRYQGDTEVVVSNNVVLRDRVSVKPLTLSASFSLYSHQGHTLTTGNNLDFVGQVHLPNAQFRLGHRNQFDGCVNSKGLRVGNDSVFSQGTFVPVMPEQ